MPCGRWSRIPELHFLLFGDSSRLDPLLAPHEQLREHTRVVHTPEAVAGDAKPSHALRQGRNSSMRLAVNAVKEGSAAAAVSAGNTGALMAMAKFVLKTLPGIDRPAMASVLPGKQRPVVVLDLGANVDCTSEHLFQFAVMGEVFARVMLDVAKPRVGLLNVGTEELKGDDVVRGAAALLRESVLPIDFRGFVEGTDVTEGVVDVVVTDGFTGNVALKIAEGTAAMFTSALREAFRSGGLRGQARLHHGQAGFRYPAAAIRPPAIQWRHVPRPERGRGEEPRRHGRAGLRGGDRRCGQSRAQLHQSEDHRGNGRIEPSRGCGHAGGSFLTVTTRSVVLGVGAYLPARVMSNDELSRSLDTSDEWIRERTGIGQRHLAADGELTSDLAVAAAREALARAGVAPADLDLILVATSTPDHTFPATATAVQAKLGAPAMIAFDLQAVCAGFAYALATADNFLRVGQARTALVIGAETFSRLLDWSDRGTCVLFGDGAGAVVLRAEQQPAAAHRGVWPRTWPRTGGTIAICTWTAALHLRHGRPCSDNGREVFRCAVGEQQYAEPGASNIAVTANAGYHFVNWSDGSTANPRTDTNVHANVSVTANFAVNTAYTVTPSSSGNGTIAPSTPQTVSSGRRTGVHVDAGGG